MRTLRYILVIVVTVTRLAVWLATLIIAIPVLAALASVELLNLLVNEN